MKNEVLIIDYEKGTLVLLNKSNEAVFQYQFDSLELVRKFGAGGTAHDPARKSGVQATLHTSKEKEA